MIRWTVSLSRSLSARAFVPFAIVINKLLDKIPGFDKLNIDSEGMKKKFGLMGEPLFLGIVIGCGIGALGCANWKKYWTAFRVSLDWVSKWERLWS